MYGAVMKVVFSKRFFNSRKIHIVCILGGLFVVCMFLAFPSERRKLHLPAGRTRTFRPGDQRKVLESESDYSDDSFLGDYNVREYSGTSSELSRTNQTLICRLPQALIIGVKKCGTRALLEYLRVHSSIRAPGPEQHFFDRYYDRGLQWYRNQMPSSAEDQITIEKTPRYFITEEAPQRILNMSEDIRLILVVRDPVVRLISDYTQAHSKGNTEGLSFDEKVYGGNDSDQVDSSWPSIRTGFYAEHLRNWLRYFPLKQIHLVDGENLISDPAEEMEGVQDFLRLRREITKDHFYFNATKGFPCVRKGGETPFVRCFDERKGRKHPYVSPYTIKRLRDFYRPLNEDFFRLTGRVFSWT